MSQLIEIEESIANFQLVDGNWSLDLLPNSKDIVLLPIQVTSQNIIWGVLY